MTLRTRYKTRRELQNLSLVVIHAWPQDASRTSYAQEQGREKSAGTKHAAHALQDGVLRRIVWMLLRWDFQDGRNSLAELRDSWANTVGNLQMYRELQQQQVHQRKENIEVRTNSGAGFAAATV
jgi:hypothetical protein